MDNILLFAVLLVFAYILFYFRGRYYLREGYTNLVSAMKTQPTKGNYIV